MSKSPIHRLLDRMYNRIQTADFDEEPIRFLENEIVVHDKLDRLVWWLSTTFIVTLCLSVGAAGFLVTLAVLERSFWDVVIWGAVLLVVAAPVPSALRERRRDLAQFAGSRAELVAALNFLKGQSDGAQ